MRKKWRADCSRRHRPVGWKDIGVDLDVLATLTLGPPLNTTVQAGRQFNFDDSSADFGDPVLNALIGWHQGNWHWNVGMLVNVPIGPWSNQSIKGGIIAEKNAFDDERQDSPDVRATP